jgi:hypothetical protein
MRQIELLMELAERIEKEQKMYKLPKNESPSGGFTQSYIEEVKEFAREATLETFQAYVPDIIADNGIMAIVSFELGVQQGTYSRIDAPRSLRIANLDKINALEVARCGVKHYFLDDEHRKDSKASDGNVIADWLGGKIGG